jgi:hypothetical protein
MSTSHPGNPGSSNQGTTQDPLITIPLAENGNQERLTPGKGHGKGTQEQNPTPQWDHVYWNVSDYYWDNDGFYHLRDPNSPSAGNARKFNEKYYYDVVNRRLVLRDHNNPDHNQEQDHSFID